MRTSRLIAALAVTTAIAAAAWLVGGSGDSDGAEPRSAAASPSEATSVAPAPSPTASGRAGVAHPAPSQVRAGRPVALTLPGGTTMAIDATATGSDGALEIPADINRAGWWDGSSRLGDPFGSVVVAAHVDSFTQGLGRFVELLDMKPGEIVSLRSRHLEQRFVVTSAHLVPKAEVTSTSPLYDVTGRPRLVLITCGGAYSPETGYADNMVVLAAPKGQPAGPPESR